MNDQPDLVLLWIESYRDHLEVFAHPTMSSALRAAVDFEDNEGDLVASIEVFALGAHSVYDERECDDLLAPVRREVHDAIERGRDLDVTVQISDAHGGWHWESTHASLEAAKKRLAVLEVLGDRVRIQP